MGARAGLRVRRLQLGNALVGESRTSTLKKNSIVLCKVEEDLGGGVNRKATKAGKARVAVAPCCALQAENCAVPPLLIFHYSFYKRNSLK